ncbi:TonB-dependent siderophore receptor [Azospirillum sp. RWY-5-1]|nr:TonB-dependent siderophore receptor [Azospirillum oleiclasticum]
MDMRDRERGNNRGTAGATPASRRWRAGVPAVELGTTLMLLALGTGSAAAAEGTRAAVTVAQAAVTAFAIPPQPVAGALLAFGRQAGVHVAVDAALLGGLTSPGVTGSLSTADALARLLTGTGLTGTVTDARTVVVRKAPDSSGALMLDPVTVEGASISATSTIGAPPPAYAGGQVARGARIGALGNRDVFDVPFSVTGFTRDLIDSQQARTMVEVLRNDPAITINQNANAGGTDDVFNIRGFLTASGDTAFDGLYGLNARQPSMEQIERVELFKGPNALFNGRAGAFSVGGAVNLVPKRATDQPVTALTTRYLSDGLFGVHADVGRRFGADKQFGVRFNGAFRDGSANIDDIDKRNEVTAVAIDYRGERFRWTGDVDYNFNRTDGAFGGMDVMPGFAIPSAPDASTQLGQSWSNLDQTKTRIASRAEWDIATDWTVSVAAGQLDVEERYQFASPILINAAGDTLLDVYTGGAQTRNRTAEAVVRGRFETGPLRHTLSFGTSWMESRVGSVFTDLSDVSSNIHNPVRWSKPAFPGIDLPTRTSQTVTRSQFAGDEIALFGERLIVTGGARRTVIETGNYSAATGAKTSGYKGDAITPAVGVAVKPMAGVTLYANYVEALESGGTAPLNAVNRDETLAPAVSDQIEAGVKADFGAIGATLALFEITKASAFTDPDTLVYATNGRQRHRGIELSTFGEPVPGLRLLAGLTVMDAEMTRTAGGAYDGKEPIGVPKVQARLFGEWGVPAVQGLSVNGTVAFTGRQYADADNTQTVNSWARLDLGARYVLDIRETPVTVRFNVENVLDTDYWSSVDRGSLYVGSPRTFLLTTTVNF